MQTGPILAQKYELLRKLGTGGMAEVFLAKQRGHSGFEKLVVIKRILPSHVDDKEFVGMFLDEARTAADLRHPNVVQVFEVGEEGGFFMAMEFLHGKDVRQIQRRLAETNDGIPVGHACQLAIDAARGLHYAHNKKRIDGNDLGIVHRDVSPQNLIVTFDGNTKLVDFGIAKAASADVQTASGVIKGKYTYMSPEQAEGFHIDGRSDQFALGIVLWELLTMRRLFKRESEMQTLRAIATDEIPPPSRYNEEVSEVLDEIVLTTLRRDPDERYDSCEYLALDLEDCMAEEGTVHSPARLGGWMREVFAGMIEPESSLHEVLLSTGQSASAPTMTAVAPREPTAETLRATPAALQHLPDNGRRSALLAAGLLAAIFIAVLGWMLLNSMDPASGTVLIRTEPPGAEVFVDDVAKGFSPVEIPDVAVNVARRLRLELAGFEPALAAFTLPPGQPRLELDYPLTPLAVEKPVMKPVMPNVVKPGTKRRPVVKQARLRIRVKPWGDVFIDGKFVGQTPLAAQKLSPGKHTLRVRNNDTGKELTREVTLGAASDALERFDLR